MSERDDDLVAVDEGCPACGERRFDWLDWDDLDTLTCATCGTRYEFTDTGRVIVEPEGYAQRRDKALVVTAQMGREGCDQDDINRVYDDLIGYREPVGEEY